jgi:hypothetical protein
MEIGCGNGSVGYQVFPSCDESMDWDLYGDVFLLCFAADLQETWAFTLPLFLSFRVRSLKAAYSRWREPIPFLGVVFWVCRIGLGVRVRVWGIHEGRVGFLRSRMPVVKIEDEDLKPYLPLRRISTCLLAQGVCTKFVYRVVSSVNIFLLWFRCMKMILFCNEKCMW